MSWLISSLLLIFCFTARVESDIHSILRELDSSDLQESIDTERLNEYRKTLIKQDILDRLGLSSPPNISDDSFLPTRIIENVLLQRNSEDEEITKDVDAYYGVTKQFVVMAEPDNPSDSREGTQVLRFHTKFPAKTISSMSLGFHRDPRVLSKEILKKEGVLSFRIIYDDVKSVNPQIHFQPAQITKTDRDWVVFNITKGSLNIDFEDNAVKNISIHIVCNLCRDSNFMWSSDDKRPFLVLNVKPSSHKRTERSSRCNNNNKECCLVDYEVKVSDLGWNNWIFAPERIYLNYCKGSCRGLGLLRHPQTLLLQRLLLKKSAKNSPFQEPCCVVTKMTSVSLLVKTDHKAYPIEKKDVPNMRALECKCL